MTHTLHRRGSRESLSEDYPVICIRAVGFNDQGYLPKAKEFLRIASRHNPVNLASEVVGNMVEFPPEKIISEADKDCLAVFDNVDDLSACLKDLKEANLGLSIVVSGVFEKVNEAFGKAGLKGHTADFSLGIWGKTDLLPSNDILEVSTMCGHGMVSTNLVKAMADEIRVGRRTPEEAVKLIAPNCTCGIFNPVRAAKLLKELTGGAEK
jgi:hypothetical protein